jgi:hypothetical protein
MPPHRTPVALILASAAGLSLVLLVGAALFTTISTPQHVDLSPNYAATINSTLGVLIGSLATWVGATGPRPPGYERTPPAGMPPPAGASPPPSNRPPRHGPRIGHHVTRDPSASAGHGPRLSQRT